MADNTTYVRLQYRNFTADSNDWVDYKDANGNVLIYPDCPTAQAAVAALRATGDKRVWRLKAAFAQAYFGV